MTSSKNPPPRAWQRMLSGRRLDLLSPDPKDIEIEDIAHGLARVARWNGQTKGTHAFSVAQHSLVVTEIVSGTHPEFTKSERLAALLHDAPEYVIGDLISPFKTAIGLDYKSFELKLLQAIYCRFEIPQLSMASAAAIKQADTFAAYYEATRLAGFEQSEAELFFGVPHLPPELQCVLSKLEAASVNDAQTLFLAKFAELSPH
jgi:5'-nucleotidase